ncbi:universal stress protein [Micromonospora sp. NPDC049559]|uniref:universal stress protein n=1 Tax=Micromonospora sp. NPDC049559 TaxID=3155923 RepID=UPI003442B4BC
MSTLTDAPVVVGVDGSPAGLRAVRLGAAEAALRRRPLRLVHAFIWKVLGVAAGRPEGGRPDEGLRPQAERMLDEAVAVAREAAPGLPVGGEVLDGEAAAVLLRESTRATMIVLGDGGLGRFTSLLVESVAIQVTAKADCPVLVARGEERPGPVVVGVDSSPVSELAVDFAAQEASLRGTELVTVHAYTHPESVGPGDLQPLVYDPRALRGDEERLVAEATAGLADRYPDLVVRHEAVRGRPAPTLVDRSGEAALVVVGAVGRGSVTGLLLGSVSQALLHHARCPLAMVHGLPEGMA